MSGICYIYVHLGSLTLSDGHMKQPTQMCFVSFEKRSNISLIGGQLKVLPHASTVPSSRVNVLWMDD